MTFLYALKNKPDMYGAGGGSKKEQVKNILFSLKSILFSLKPSK